jgi:hypothetical protein
VREATYPPAERLLAAHTRAECPAAWSCRRWGLPCRRRRRRRGALLPHHFTFTQHLFDSVVLQQLVAIIQYDAEHQIAAQTESNKCWAVYFLWHFPAGCPGWPLATTVPCPARTFLPALICLGCSAAVYSIPHSDAKCYTAAQTESNKCWATARPTLFIYILRSIIGYCFFSCFNYNKN